MLVTKSKDRKSVINPGIMYSSVSFNRMIDGLVRTISPSRGPKSLKSKRLIIRMIVSNCLSNYYQPFTLYVSNGFILEGKHYSHNIVSKVISRLVYKGYILYKKGGRVHTYSCPSQITPTDRLISLISRNCEGVTIKKRFDRVVIKLPNIKLESKVVRGMISCITDDIIEVEERLSKYKFKLRGETIIISPIVRHFKYDLDHHGRLYSPISPMKKKERGHISIDDELTCEVDMVSSTLTIAILHVGGTPPKDFYAFHHDRDVAKTVSTVCFYSKSLRGVAQACSLVLKNKYGKSVDDISDVINRAEDWFKINGIHHLFCKGQGLRFMKIESDFCLDTILTCLRSNIPVLSIHDSFICKVSDKDKLRLCIDLVYKKHFGALPLCTIKL